MPFNGAGAYGSQGRAQTVRMPPADVLPLERRDLREELRQEPTAIPQSVEDRLIERLVARLQDIGVFDPRKYVTISSQWTLVNDEGQLLLERPTNKRVYLFIENVGGDDIYIDFDKPAMVGTSVPLFADGGFFEWLNVIPQNIIYSVADVGEAGQAVVLFAEMPDKGRMRDRG